MVSRRWSVNASLPLLLAYRNQLYVPRGEYRVAGLGDMTVGGHAWLFRSPTESGANVGVGVSLKLPTGKYNATGLALDRSGNTITGTATQSIQAGDGGTGFALDPQA
jgi:outer membrane putative beta-barrel porin/alpha-amylase